MAVKLVQPASQLIPPTPRITNIITKTHRLALSLHIHPFINNTRFGEGSIPIHIAKVAEQSSGLAGEEDNGTVVRIKEDLYQALIGTNRGIFGVPSAKKSEIHGLVELLESQNPTPHPTLNLHKVDGCWKLLYSTITILGSKRTKLGLRDFISLGDFFQNVDIVKGKAVNIIKFNVRGLNLLNGQLTIEASFQIASKSRVEINYEGSTIVPDQLLKMFKKNYNLLLGIFNPEGWLEITYVDNDTRIGRDDKSNVFILQRSRID